MIYHREVYWPNQIERLTPKGIIPLLYSQHAIKASKTDRYGHIELPEFLNTSLALAFECEINDGQIKFCFRTKLDNVRDIILVIIRTPAGWLVKTVWINLASDEHKTLQKKSYATS